MNHVASLETHIISVVKKKRMHVSELNNWRKNVLLQMFAFFLFPF